jgi:hypothetical protein
MADFSNVSSKLRKCSRIAKLLENKQIKMLVIMVSIWIISSGFKTFVKLSSYIKKWSRVVLFSNDWVASEYLPSVNYILVSRERDPPPGWTSRRCQSGNICSWIRNRRGDPQCLRQIGSSTSFSKFSVNSLKMTHLQQVLELQIDLKVRRNLCILNFKTV